MKTDRFADSIRRKLDSIRPEFDNRDWARMQNSLRQAGMTPDLPVVRPFWGSAARMAAAGVAGTALFLTTTIWQHYELKRVRQTLEEVTQSNHVAPSQKPPTVAPAPSDGSVASGSETNPAQATTRIDTVYITRYVPVPGNQPTGNQSPSIQDRRLSRDQYAATDGNSVRPDYAQPDATLPATTVPATSVPGVTSPGNTVPVTTVPPANAPSATPGVGRSTVAGNAGQSAESNTSGQPRTTSRGSRTDIATGGLPGRQSRATGTDNVAVVTDRADRPADVAATSQPIETSQQAGRFDLATGLPMHFDTVYWDKKLAQRARRMRPARTLPTGEKSPVGRRIEPMIVQVRMGVTGEVNTRLWSTGGLVELLAGKHWTVGAGLQYTNFATGTFLTDDDFNQKTRRDFRRNYARGLDPRHEILNISTDVSRVQVPLSVGYRFPVTPTFAILPTLGTNLNLYSQEHVTFYFRVPLPAKGFDMIKDRINRPVDLFNNMTLSPMLEWQQKHWGWQAGPSLTVPLKTDPYYKQNVTASLRARAFYRF